WIADKTITVLFQDGQAPSPLLKDVPYIADQAKTPDERAAIEFLYAGQGLSRPFIAPPGVPADRTKMLQDAFMATAKDPEFIADANRQKLPVNPKSGVELAALIKKIYATPKPIVERVSDLIK